MKKLLLILFFAVTPLLIAQQSASYFDLKTLDANNIILKVTNIGNSLGGNWKILSDIYSGIIFDHGPWLIGKVNTDTALAFTQWFFNSYSPGPIINGQPAMQIHPEDSLRYRVYKISKGDDSTNIDYAEWPVDFGAPVDGNGKPLVLGDQTLWTVYNSLDSNDISSWTTDPVKPFPIEIRQTIFSRNGNADDASDIFANTAFIEYEIINKGNEQIDSAYFGFWSDIDFEDIFDNRPGVDSAKQIGYCWTATTTTSFDSVPPAVGYAFLYGPVIPSTGNSATFRGRQLNNFKNLELNTFHGIADDGDPRPLTTPARSIFDAWNFANGLDANGDVIINPITNNPTRFPYNGDPVSSSGWYYNDSWGVGGGSGFIYFSGPFTFAPNDTQWTMIAIVPGKGENNLNSVTKMRYKTNMLRSLPYDSLAFGTLSFPITGIKDEDNSVPNNFTLYQNYPNPFNPSTKIRFVIPNVVRNLKDFSSQTPRNDNANVTLKVYDVLGNEVATLVNEEKPAGNYEVNFDASALSSGVYFYQLKAGTFIQTKKMVLIK